MKDLLRVGVVGVHRGAELMKFAKVCRQMQIVAVCECNDEIRERYRVRWEDSGVAWYGDYESFLTQSMDAVLLANNATEHAPLAVRAMEAGFDVMSEVLPCQNPAEAVRLVEAVERTGRRYCYLENFCYMPATAEMRRLYREGVIGEFRYGEGEYVHNCETLWPDITYGDRAHWRNNIHALFYCTHSVGPLIHITGLRPVKVTGFELPYTAQKYRMGSKAGGGGIEMVTLENGAVFKSIHGSLYRNSVWFTVYGEKGRMESAREDAGCGDTSRIYVNADSYEGEYAPESVLSYTPIRPNHWDGNGFGHARADFYVMLNAVRFLLGDSEAEVIDVYEALDMAMPGMFGYFSVLAGGVPMALPDFRTRADRDRYRNDLRCTNPAVAGEQVLPCYSGGDAEIPDAVYEAVRADYEAHRVQHGIL